MSRNYPDIECPYCKHEQDINHDDGYGYSEDEIHQQTCGNCDKTFTFTTSISFSYEVSKADCLNDGEHDFEATTTYPKDCTKMECTMCSETRVPTKKEYLKIIGEDINKPNFEEEYSNLRYFLQIPKEKTILNFMKE